NKADTLRSSYYLNLYGSVLLNAENKNDSAYLLLKKAYLQEFQLDFRRNTLEINRLIVELETREKENANLRLREARVWLLLALVGTALVAVTAYLAYTFQRTKNIKQTREAEIKVENLIREQELSGINSMLEGQEKERKRIANELHDDLGSLIATLKLHLHALKGHTIKDNHSEELLEKTDLLINETYDKVRAIAHMRNAGVSAQEGLLPAIKNFASKVSIVNSLVVEVNEHGIDGHLENSLEITVFRIIQELIANIIKHAKASNAIIHLTQHQESINIMVEDNGVGFDIALIKPSAGMGLYSIQRRVENIGGSVTIESIPNSGTTVIIDLPIA
ncbi:MAG TPA: sensor histidine kinase, partial [Chryseolinea sp.]|nr:sensor histidine kinase [Chryseolinea sp.]